MGMVGFYAGSFDPFTNGHLQIVKKSIKCFDKVIFAIPNDVHSENYTKAYNVLIGEKED